MLQKAKAPVVDRLDDKGEAKEAALRRGFQRGGDVKSTEPNEEARNQE